MTATVDYVRRKKEAAKICGLSPRTLDRLTKLGKGPARTKITDRIVGYRDSAIKAYLDSRTS